MPNETIEAAATELPPLESYEEGKVPTHYAPTNIEVRNGVITAQKVALPRDEGKILKKIAVLAAYAREDWYYRWPTKNKDGSTGWVEGPSVKCAMAVARVFGNCEVDCRVQDSATHHVFLARFIDIETGFSVTRPFQQRKSQTIGKKMDAERQADIVFQIGTSKATRNVICNALETFCDFAFDQARKSLIDAIGKDMEKYRKIVLDRVTENDIDLKRVEHTVGKPAKDWLAPDIAKVRAQIQSIIDGMSSKDEAFPPTPDELAAHEKAVQSEAEKPKPKEPTNEELDMASAIDDLIIGLNACKSVKAVDELVSENDAIIKAASAKASKETQVKWAEAYSKKLASFKQEKK
jgi:hypothetical protein